MEYAIWGVGSVGIGLASALAGPDMELLLVGRDEATRAAIQAHGIDRSGFFGHRRIPPDQLRFETDPECLLEATPRWILICTKAYSSPDIARSLETLSSRISPQTKIVLCQNGWGNEAPFLSFWPTDRLFHGRVITGFRRHRLYEVEITAHAAPIAIGSLFGHSIDGMEEIASRMSRGGIPAETSDDMEGILWAKMLYNCALNPLGALTNRRYGELADQPQTRELISQIVTEIFAVLGRAGSRVAWPDAEAYLETFFRDLIPPTAAHESSMLQDLRAGRPTEIDALCGAVERLGEKHGVATPVISALAQLVRVAESKSSED